jgi:hypothetical protein
LHPRAALVNDAARIHALAVGRSDAGPGWRSRQVRRAVDLIRQALGALPEGQRAAFWRDNVQPDKALAPIRRSPEFLLLAVPQ